MVASRHLQQGYTLCSVHPISSPCLLFSDAVEAYDVSDRPESDCGSTSSIPLSPEIRRVSSDCHSVHSSQSSSSQHEPSLLTLYHSARSLHRTISEDHRARVRRDSVVVQSGHHGHQLAAFQWSIGEMPQTNLLAIRRAGLGKSAPTLSTFSTSSSNSLYHPQIVPTQRTILTRNARWENSRAIENLVVCSQISS